MPISDMMFFHLFYAGPCYGYFGESLGLLCSLSWSKKWMQSIWSVVLDSDRAKKHGMRCGREKMQRGRENEEEHFCLTFLYYFFCKSGLRTKWASIVKTTFFCVIYIL